MKFMNILKRFILFLMLGLFIASLNAQDAVLLINGKLLERKITDVNDNFITFEKNKKRLFSSKIKTSLIKVETSSVFSVKYSSGMETVLYKPNPDAGFTLQEQEMQAFVYGEKWGRENFRAPWSTVMGFVAGAAGGYYQFYGVPVPVVASVVIGLNKPKASYYKRMPQGYAENPYFAAGFKDYGRKKKTANAIKGGLAGFLTMTLLNTYLSNQD